MHYRKKHPTKVMGNKCGMCQWLKMLGNSKGQRKPSDRRADDAAKQALHEVSHR